MSVKPTNAAQAYMAVNQEDTGLLPDYYVYAGAARAYPRLERAEAADYKPKAIEQLHLYVYAHTVAMQAVICAYHRLKQAGQQSRGCNVEHLRLLC